jgi:hypothetical protein
VYHYINRRSLELKRKTPTTPDHPHSLFPTRLNHLLQQEMTHDPRPLGLTILSRREEGKTLSPCKTPQMHFHPSHAYHRSHTGEAPLITQSLRCFQMHHAPRMIREFSVLHASPETAASTASHQASKESSAPTGAI